MSKKHPTEHQGLVASYTYDPWGNPTTSTRAPDIGDLVAAVAAV